jgi:hypothetical protein
MVFLSKRSNYLEVDLPTSVEKDQKQVSAYLKKSIVTKIGTSANKIFSNVKSALCFPLRYLGSKTWSLPGILMRLPGLLLFGWNKSESITEQLFTKGYEYESQELTKEMTKSFLRNACIASSIAVATDVKMPRKMEEEWLEPYGLQVLSPESMFTHLKELSGNIEINDKRFLDRNSGLKMMIVTNNDEAIITFGAAGSAQNEFNDALKNPAWKTLQKHVFKSVYSNLLGTTPAIYKQAEELYLAIKDHPFLLGKKITLIGHCMGGALASYIGIKHQIQVNGFNTLALGTGIQKEIGADKLKNANNYVTHISISKDFFSDPQSSTIDRIVNFMGIRTPGNFGKHFTVPAYSDYNKSSDGIYLSRKNQTRIHNFYVGSMMAYVGYNYRDKPITLAQNCQLP